ncbi:MAG: tripartite tricarboxylate transporter substrate binding protein [Burkholderiales bacterium]
MANYAAFALLLWVGATSAQTPPYPTKPVRLIVPFSAAGPTDLVARLIAPKLTEALGQPFIVDNRVGAGGNIGMAAVAKAAPDGYTVLVAGSSFPVNASLFAEPGYDPIKDFAPISNLAVTPMIIVANPALAARSIADIVKLARSPAARLSLASPGIGTLPHLLAERWNRADGIALELIHYKGGAQSTTSVVSGENAIGMGAVSSYMGLIRGGKVVPIAVTSPRRLDVLPDTPTVAEAGQPLLEAEALVGGLLVPAATSKEIVAILHREVVKVMQSPEVRDRLRAVGVGVLASTPDEFAAELRSEVARWGRVIREASIKPN